MKKGGVKASGAITLIMYLLLFIISTFYVLSIFLDPVAKILNDVDILGKIVNLAIAPFVTFPLMLIASISTSISAELIETLTKVLPMVLAVFSLYMFFWGIKEITLGKKDDYRFARCKKTCAFMHIIKFFVFLYLVAVIVCTFLMDLLKLFFINVFGALYGFEYIFIVVTGVLAFLQFLCFVLAVANINKVAKAVKNGQVQNDPNANYDPNYQNGGYDPYQQQPQYNQGSQMQANMPPMNNGYAQPQYQQQPQQYQQQYQQPQYQQQYPDAGSSTIVPGQNGIPINITQKGIQDLERLERLKQSGAITDANYIVMRTKICNSNLG